MKNSTDGSISACPDLLSDRDTAEATYQVVRGLAGGLVLVYLAFTLYHATADTGAAAKTVMMVDQLPLLASLSAFVLMAKHLIPMAWAHRVAVMLGLLVAVNTAISVVIQREGSDLRYMQAVVLGAGTIALSGRAVVVMLLGTAAMAVPAALVVCSRGEFMDFAVMQTVTSMFSVALWYARLPGQKKLLHLRQTAAQSAAELGLALARAERAFAEHRRSDEKRRELEEHLRQSQKLEALGTLAGGVAHDMNNVLGTITVIASGSLRPTSEGSSIRQDLADILDAARKGAALTRNILSFARRGTTESAPFHIDDVVAEVETLLVRTMPKHVTLAVDCQAQEAWVAGDAGQIAHLLTNLCLNAADAIEHQGAIQVRTRLVHLTSEQATKLGAAAGAHVELTVVDNGRGIAPDVLPRVFEPFFSAKEGGGHAGLGLAMVYGTVQQHHGGIVIQSAVGQGTTVTIVLPRLNQLPRQVAVQAPGVVPVDPARNCLLLVDDESMIRHGGQRLARHLGFEVLTASDGREALDVFAKHKAQIGAVILDVAMPVMNGADCCWALRQLAPDLPILLTSGFPKDHDIQALLENPHTRYVRKPYDQDDLAVALGGMMGAAGGL
jgi:signal transduction histidine kinase/CheY-like chemotaxis protein